MTEIADLRTAGARDTAQDAGLEHTAGQPQGAPAERDIRVLARSTKERISQRMSAQMEAVNEPLWSSSTSALRAVSLPEPGDSSCMGDDPRSAGLPAWIYAAVGAATAAAAMFFLLRGDASEHVRTSHAHQARVGDTDGQTRGARAPSSSETSSGGLEPRAMTAGAAPQLDSPPEGQSGDGAGRAGQAEEPSGSPAAGEVRAVSGRAGDQAPARAAEDRATSPPAERAIPAPASEDRRSEQIARAEEHAAAHAGARPDRTVRAPAEPATPAPADSAESGDALDELLAAASGGGAGADSRPGSHAAAPGPESTAAEDAPDRAELGRSDVKKAMGRIRAEVDACYAQFQVPGTVMIRFGVKPDGRVASARAIGPFKGTDTGTCVADAVKTAELPAYDGAPMTFTYPFLLTP